ncbi:hypothetical protein GLOTRDRAFT_138488 [Gloeophyllum trabeum ATCC 11539]|uniref:RNI-like protein n=1 Tax=Gloeophyllum trabeum (strain ATCC 11539 / FP-39264 / Madison 617) TaxID=670483 RepID=S7Q7Z1_GLOTA|nr:uncharacterized protein GLOTRDRAFT_138488 [Gloeophyllum trabeum ATCC 11539]EPQ55647.1 hypothetical protein GLOTRDRAFT_138488 [Gloeophyllum trabeum ATCC 11539]
MYISGSHLHPACDAIRSFPSLQTLSVNPDFSGDISRFLRSLSDAIHSLHHTLRTLEVWESCFIEQDYYTPGGINSVNTITEDDEEQEDDADIHDSRANADVLMDICPADLKSLIIHNPKTTLLANLPGWIDRLRASGKLSEIALIDNAGPNLSVGLSYSLTDTNLFSALNSLHELRELSVCYYLQLNTPSVLPSLPNLRNLRVTHTGPPISTIREATLFSKFVRRIIRDSPTLEEIELRREGFDHKRDLQLSCTSPRRTHTLFKSFRDPSPSLTPLILHLATARHSVKVLKMADFFVNAKHLAKFCKARGQGIEHLEIGIGRAILLGLSQTVASLTNLKRLQLRVTGVRRKLLNGCLEAYGESVGRPSERWIDPFVRKLPGGLFWLDINGREWEISWACPSPAKSRSQSEIPSPTRVVTEMQRKKVVWE